MLNLYSSKGTKMKNQTREEENSHYYTEVIYIDIYIYSYRYRHIDTYVLIREKEPN